MRSPLNTGLFVTTLVASTLAVALVVGWWQVDGPGAAEVVDGKRPLPLTEMAFSMTDQDGRAVGPEDLVGRPSLVFFGFTSCPDVCPTTLSDISTWLEDLGPAADSIDAVLITVDTDRDTVVALADDLTYFDPRIRGWTGPDHQDAAAARGFRATYAKVARGDGDDTMNHTAGI